MKDISQHSMAKLEGLVNTAMKTLQEVTEREMLRTGYKPTSMEKSSMFKTFSLLYQSGVINHTVETAHAMLLEDQKTEHKEA